MTAPPTMPARRTRLFGRDDDLAALRRLLASAAGRLVTILGPGGCGKTTLALQLAHEAIPALADDGYWVALDNCTEPSAVAALIASTVGTGEGSRGTTADGLVGTLADRQTLLVLDNCEHVRAAVAPLVDTLLSGCPDLRVLTTSRAPLNVRGEEVFLLQPLAVPGETDVASEGLELVPSVALFLDRSRAAGRELALDRKRLEAVAHICTRLDGLPLAIELAAAQTLAFSPEQIAEHLRERLPLPTRTATSGVERQQTMQRALDWSYELLSEPQQRLVEACGVFGGPWTVEALQSLSPEVADIPAGLARLVEHSLVAVVDAPGDRRYRLLGPVREYALARLERSGRLMEAQDRHARHYREVARQIGRPAWDEALTPLAIRRLEADHDNFLAALARADAAGDVDSTRRLTELLWPFWRRTGRLYLGYERFKQLVAMDHLAPAHKGFAYSGLANFTQLLGDRAAASALARTALAHYRDAGLIPGEIVATGMLAEIAAEGGDYEEARRRYREAIAIAPEGPAGEWIVALARLGLGFTEYWAGNFDESESLLNQGLAALRSRASWHVGLAHLRIGGIARQRGALDKALEEGRLGLRLVHKLGGGQEVAHALEELSATELALCRLTRAATLLGSASILRETTRSTPAPADEHAVKAAHTATRNGLGESTFTAAWVNGRASTREIAVAYALSDSSASDLRVAPLASLTSRESEVARLVAKGLSNAQIAAQLVISDATARTHVERIRSKLGVHSRTQIARVVMGAPSDP